MVFVRKRVIVDSATITVQIKQKNAQIFCINFEAVFKQSLLLL